MSGLDSPNDFHRSDFSVAGCLSHFFWMTESFSVGLPTCRAQAVKSRRIHISGVISVTMPNQRSAKLQNVLTVLKQTIYSYGNSLQHLVLLLLPISETRIRLQRLVNTSTLIMFTYCQWCRNVETVLSYRDKGAQCIIVTRHKPAGSTMRHHAKPYNNI